MRPFHDVLVMWNQYEDRELLDWQWTYERLLRRSSIHSEYMSQDLKAISQILHKRGM